MVVITDIKHCLFDNYDKTIIGICTSCDEYVELKIQAGIFLSAVFVATVLLGRSVSVFEIQKCIYYVMFISPIDGHDLQNGFSVEEKGLFIHTHACLHTHTHTHTHTLSLSDSR